MQESPREKKKKKKQEKQESLELRYVTMQLQVTC